MVNNIGKLTSSKSFNTNLGEATSNISSSDITLLTGALGKGLLVFDQAGTLAVVSDYISDSNFTIRTYAVSIDVNSILNLSY